MMTIRDELIPRVVNPMKPNKKLDDLRSEILTCKDENMLLLLESYTEHIEIPCIIPLYIPKPEPSDEKISNINITWYNLFIDHRISRYITEYSNTIEYKMIYERYTKCVEELVVLYNKRQPFAKLPLPIMPDTYLELDIKIKSFYIHFHYFDKLNFAGVCSMLDNHILQLKKGEV
jgi:hypothetical protein